MTPEDAVRSSLYRCTVHLLQADAHARHSTQLQAKRLEIMRIRDRIVRLMNRKKK